MSGAVLLGAGGLHPSSRLQAWSGNVMYSCGFLWQLSFILAVMLPDPFCS